MCTTVSTFSDIENIIKREEILDPNGSFIVAVSPKTLRRLIATGRINSSRRKLCLQSRCKGLYATIEIHDLLDKHGIIDEHTLPDNKIVIVGKI